MFVSTDITINVKVQTMSLSMSIYSLHYLKYPRLLKKKGNFAKKFHKFQQNTKIRCTSVPPVSRGGTGVPFAAPQTPR